MAANTFVEQAPDEDALGEWSTHYQPPAIFQPRAATAVLEPVGQLVAELDKALVRRIMPGADCILIHLFHQLDIHAVTS